MKFLHLLISYFGFLLSHYLARFGVVPSPLALSVMLFVVIVTSFFFRLYSTILMKQLGRYYSFFLWMTILVSGALVLSYGRILFHAFLTTNFFELYYLLGAGILILGPADILVTRMMPGGSEDSANSGSGSGNWRDFLNISPEQGARGNSNEPVAETAVANPPAQLSADTLEGCRRVLETHRDLAREIPAIFRNLRTTVPAGFQSERLAEMLEDRFGAEALGGILESLREAGRESPFFRQVQADFSELRQSGGTEATLRREWQGRGR